MYPPSVRNVRYDGAVFFFADGLCFIFDAYPASRSSSRICASSFSPSARESASSTLLYTRAPARQARAVFQAERPHFWICDTFYKALRVRLRRQSRIKTNFHGLHLVVIIFKKHLVGTTVYPINISGYQISPKSVFFAVLRRAPTKEGLLFLQPASVFEINLSISEARWCTRSARPRSSKKISKSAAKLSGCSF